VTTINVKAMKIATQCRLVEVYCSFKENSSFFLQCKDLLSALKWRQ